MSGDAPRRVTEGALTVLEGKRGYLFAMGWFRPVNPSELGRKGMVPDLLLGPPGNLILVRPLALLTTPPDQPGLRHFHALLHAGEDWPEVMASLRLGDEIFPLTQAPRTPSFYHRRGALEPLGRAGIAGWVFDLPGEVPELRVDGRHIVPITLDRDRPDLPFNDVLPGRPLGFNLSLETLGQALRGQDLGLALMDGQPHEVALLLGGKVQAQAVIRHARSLSGRLERASPPMAEGWATEAHPGPGPVTVDVLLDGTRWQTVRADLPRKDLLDQGVGSRLRGGAMRIALPWRNPTDVAEPQLSLRAAHGTEILPGATPLESLPPWRPQRGGVLDALPAEWPPVTVIIPIHNAAEDLERCIGAVLKHSTGPTRLLLIDDASPDPRVAEVLARYEGRPGVEVRRNAVNMGFTATSNLGLDAAGRDDVVLLNSDTMVGPGWLDGLRLAAGSGARVGTVTPLSNNAGAFSVPEIGQENHLAPWFTYSDMARLARQASLALWPEVPTGHGFCLYIRRDCLDAVGKLDEAAFPRGYGEENDFCLRAQRAGFRNILDDRTLVWHRRSASFGEARDALMAQGRALLEERYPEYGRLTPIFAEAPALLAIRWRVRKAVERALAMGTTPRPRVLFVISTQSGGTPQTNRDLMEALSDRYEPWLLRCEAGLVELFRAGEEAVESVRLETPVAPATHASAEYDRTVADMLLRHGIELVHIRHIAWHGIGMPALCRRLGIPVVFSFHDFYTVCPTVKLLDAEGRFCGGRCTAGAKDCAAELWPQAQIPPLRHRFVHRWQTMMADALAACDAFVTTAPSARETLLAAFPMLRERGLRVIPHGRDFERMERLAEEPDLDEPLRVLVPGNVSQAKGSALIAAMAALDTGREVEFHMLGEVDHHLRAPRVGVVLHGGYRREEFAARVRAIRPHMAAVLSIWPETWCHTLTECWAAGLPVLTFDLGAQGERVAASGAGWLLPTGSDAGQVLDWLIQTKRDPSGFHARELRVVQWQREFGRHHNTLVMAANYDLLYRELLEKRRSFLQEDADAIRSPVVLEVRGRERADSVLPEHRPGLALLRVPVTAGFPFARHGSKPLLPAGQAFGLRPDAVMISARALAAQDLPGLIGRCRAAGLLVLVDVDDMTAEALSRPDAAAAREAVQAEGVCVLGRRPITLQRLASLGIAASRMPGPRQDSAWQHMKLEPQPARQDHRARVLLLDDESGAASPMLALLEDLAALEVVELLSSHGERAPGADAWPTPRFLTLAHSCDAAVVLGPISAPHHDPLLQNTLQAGLPVFVAAEGWPEEEAPAPGLVIVPRNPDEAARVIVEWLADATARERIRRFRAAGPSSLTRQAPPDEWEMLLRSLLSLRDHHRATTAGESRSIFRQTDFI